MDRVRFDYTNVMADVVGPEHGLDEAELGRLESRSAEALRAVQARRATDLRWLDLPYQHEVHDGILAYADGVAGRFRDVVVLGIGGSALGTSALQGALNSPYHNLGAGRPLPRLFVLDNVDPDLIGEFLEHCDPAQTLFNVISKSGATAETMAQFLIFRRALLARVGRDALREQIVVTTDATRGALREIAGREGYASFVVPAGVGGRFSVLSPVGLLPLALVGVDIKGVLKGAADMDAICRNESQAHNPALMHAAVQWLMQTRKHKPIAVTLAYSQRLALLADWYAQLLAESIGKRRSRSGADIFAGPTPVKAVGVTDQHSQVQLYTEGPFDKWFTLLAVDEPDHAVEIPPAFEDLEAVAYLGGRTLKQLFQAERDGTRAALCQAGRPNASFWLTKVEPHQVGQLLQLLQVSVAVMGEHYDVDAFDQPGVEAGKAAAHALMGRAGYEQLRSGIEAAAERGSRLA